METIKIINKLRDYLRSLDEIKKPFLEPNHLKVITEFEERLSNLFIKELELEKGDAKIEVAIIGGFSSGKSTFINSILADKICPMQETPTTASVTKFYFAPEKTILLNGKKISQEEYTNLTTHSINEEAKDSYFVEYGYPSPIFANINLYDTPGFSNNQRDTKITKELLKKIDVILYVVDVTHGTIGDDEIKILRELLKNNNKIWIVLNKIDRKPKNNLNNIIEGIKSLNISNKITTYSAKKVLEELVDNKLNLWFEHIQKNLIPKEEVFNIEIKTQKDVISETKSYYNLIINNEKIKIDYSKASQKREEILNILNNVATQKNIILKNSFCKEKDKTYKTLIYFLKKLLEFNPQETKHIGQVFNEQIEMFFNDFRKFEENFLNRYIENVKNNCIASLFYLRVDEHIFADTEYFYILNTELFNKNFKIEPFQQEIKEYLNYMNEPLYNKYGYKLEFSDEDIYYNLAQIANRFFGAIENNTVFFNVEFSSILNHKELIEEIQRIFNETKSQLGLPISYELEQKNKAAIQLHINNISGVSEENLVKFRNDIKTFIEKLNKDFVC